MYAVSLPLRQTLNDMNMEIVSIEKKTFEMMVAAFGGYETVMNAYKIAREEKYRFGTYGDAMLIL